MVHENSKTSPPLAAPARIETNQLPTHRRCLRAFSDDDMTVVATADIALSGANHLPCSQMTSIGAFLTKITCAYKRLANFPHINVKNFNIGQNFCSHWHCKLEDRFIGQFKKARVIHFKLEYRFDSACFPLFCAVRSAPPWNCPPL